MADLERPADDHVAALLNNPAFQAAVTELVDQRASEIRARAKADHSDELHAAGYTTAAEFLRNLDV